jgi:hypothetical protein
VHEPEADIDVRLGGIDGRRVVKERVDAVGVERTDCEVLAPRPSQQLSSSFRAVDRVRALRGARRTA